MNERLGLHLLFGAFMTGAMMPKEQRFDQYVLERFETVTVTLLQPLFFAFTGPRTNIGLVKGVEMGTYCGWILLVATVGKLGGSTLVSWLTGMPMQEAAGLGRLMKTRWLDGVGDSRYRSGHQGHFAGIVFQDGGDGFGHDFHGDSAAEMVLSGPDFAGAISQHPFGGASHSDSGIAFGEQNVRLS